MRKRFDVASTISRFFQHKKRRLPNFEKQPSLILFLKNSQENMYPKC